MVMTNIKQGMLAYTMHNNSDDTLCAAPVLVIREQ